MNTRTEDIRERLGRLARDTLYQNDKPSFLKMYGLAATAAIAVLAFGFWYTRSLKEPKFTSDFHIQSIEFSPLCDNIDDVLFIGGKPAYLLPKAVDRNRNGIYRLEEITEIEKFSCSPDGESTVEGKIIELQ